MQTVDTEGIAREKSHDDAQLAVDTETRDDNGHGPEMRGKPRMLGNLSAIFIQQIMRRGEMPFDQGGDQAQRQKHKKQAPTRTCIFPEVW